MARVVKAFLNNPNVRKHRDHRSKKGRRSMSGKSISLDKKRKLEKIIIKEYDEERR